MTTTYLPAHAGVYEGSVSEVEDGIVRDLLWDDNCATDVLRVDGEHRAEVSA